MGIENSLSKTVEIVYRTLFVYFLIRNQTLFGIIQYYKKLSGSFKAFKTVGVMNKVRGTPFG